MIGKQTKGHRSVAVLAMFSKRRNPNYWKQLE